jgi:MarR family
VTDERAQAERCAELFRAVYLTFHRRDGPRSQLTGASRAVLEHLALAGPLTVGEAAAHLARAQSVISEIVTHLVCQGLLEREVLSVDHLAPTMARLPPAQADDLIAGLRALVGLAAARKGSGED